MIAIEDLLVDLLIHHPCVIIPKFGGFVAKQTSAKIDLERNTVLPPSKHLLFNKHLIANDGLLVNELANKNKLTFTESENQVSLFVQTINSSLKNAKQFQIPKIGTFHTDQEGNISFEQDRYFNLLLNAYGLTSVHFIATKVEEPVREQVIETPIIPIEKGKRNLWKYAAAACILPLAFYSIWIPTKTDVIESGLISFKDFNPFYKQEVGTYKKHPLKLRSLNKSTSEKSFEDRITHSSTSDIANFELEPEHVFAVKIEKPVVQNTEINEEVHTTNSNFSLAISNSKFQYVLGCFANPENAKRLSEKLQNAGFEVNQSTAGSLIRISVGSTKNMDSLQQVIEKANGLGYQGWILKN